MLLLLFSLYYLGYKQILYAEYILRLVSPVSDCWKILDPDKIRTFTTKKTHFLLNQYQGFIVYVVYFMVEREVITLLSLFKVCTV